MLTGESVICRIPEPRPLAGNHASTALHQATVGEEGIDSMFPPFMLYRFGAADIGVLQDMVWNGFLGKKN